MLIAHLPAGYLATRLSLGRSPGLGRCRRLCLAWGLLGSVAPDLDMLYFHLIDQRRHHHHSYVTHYPVVWIALTLAALFAWRRSGGRTAAAMLCFASNGLLHQLLDSVVGDIRWLAPWSDRAFALATVPALYRPWWLNFLLHWSFGLELILLLGALAAFLKKSRGEA